MQGDADRIVGLYERRAGEWDQARSRGLFEKSWLDRFIALVPRPRTVLDIGCGSGEPIARHLVDSGVEVTGVDAAPAMIGMCRARLPGEWIIADMRRLSMGRRFGGLLAWDSLFHLTPDDQREMFPIFQAHAQPGAAVMFTSGPASGEAIGEFQGERLYHASLDAAEYSTLLDSHGFAVVAHVAEDPRCGGHAVWLARRI